jgi:hypothetical protein
MTHSLLRFFDGKGIRGMRFGSVGAHGADGYLALRCEGVLAGVAQPLRKAKQVHKSLLKQTVFLAFNRTRRRRHVKD